MFSISSGNGLNAVNLSLEKLNGIFVTSNISLGAIEVELETFDLLT
jgi:hypothetical protein